MHVWYHKKDNLILFKMIPYLLGSFHQGKGSISKYRKRSPLKSCKTNTIQWSWSVHKEHVLLCGVTGYVFCSQLVSSSTSWGCGARRWCRHKFGSSTRYWALVMSLKSTNTDEIKDPCDNKHENLCKTSPCHFIFMPLLWLMSMWWT